MANLAPLETLDVKLDAPTLADLQETITAFARAMDDPDRIAFIQIDEDAASAVLGIAPTAGAAETIARRRTRTTGLAALLAPDRTMH
jgi:hypothetical protein